MRELVLMLWDLPIMLWEMPWEAFLLYGLVGACVIWLFWVLCGLWRS